MGQKLAEIYALLASAAAASALSSVSKEIHT